MVTERKQCLLNYFSYQTFGLDAKIYGRHRLALAQDRWETTESIEERQIAGRWAGAWGMVEDSIHTLRPGAKGKGPHCLAP